MGTWTNYTRSGRFFFDGCLGRRSKSYEAVNSVETAVYFQVSERLNWNMDEIPEVYPFYSYVDWVENPSASVLPDFLLAEGRGY